MIRDKIIEKTSIPRIQARLLMEPDTLTLERTIIIATQIEITIKEAKNFQSDNSKFSKMKSEFREFSTVKTGRKCRATKITVVNLIRSLVSNTKTSSAVTVDQ